MKIMFDWGVSSLYGWGVYGLNMAIEFSRMQVEALTSFPIKSDQIFVDKIRKTVIREFIVRSHQYPILKTDDFVGLSALGNEFEGANSKIGVIFFEFAVSEVAIEKAKTYDIIITGSTWAENTLRAHGIKTVRTLIQGVDRSLFHPAPRRPMFPGRFIIFSGGKAEPRKGQDLVVRAFRLFARRHPDAMLVTAWHSPWPGYAKGMDLDLSEFGKRVIDVGQVPNGQMAQVYQQCHVALFPNRSEGGTNLVAMECIACGIPTIVSANTGHLDLIRLSDVRPLSRPEDIDEMLHALELAYDGHIFTSGHNLPEWESTAIGLVQAAKDVS